MSVGYTLPAIYVHGLIGAYHDWCATFSTYPRSYDLLHGFHLFSRYKGYVEGYDIEDIMLEMDHTICPQSKADTFEYADQVLEKWYPTIEEGNNKGIVVLVTTLKEVAITGGPAFISAVGDTILDATVSENLPLLATAEKYNEAIFSTAKRLVDGLPDPGGTKFKDNKRESNFKSREETQEKRGQCTLVV